MSIYISLLHYAQYQTLINNTLHCLGRLTTIHLVGAGHVNLVILILIELTNSCKDTGLVCAKCRTQVVLRGHGGAMRRPKLAT